MSTISTEILPSSPAAKDDWDAFVLAHPSATPYHLFAWGTAIEKAYGHTFNPLTARQNDKLVGVLPLVHMKFPPLLNELVALPFCDVGNCLALDTEKETKLLTETMTQGGRFKTKNIQLRGALLQPVNSQTDFAQMETNKVRMLLCLPESSELLFNNFTSKLRSQIRKAKKNGVSFRWAHDDGIEPFYSVFSENMHDLGSPVHSKSFFKAIVENYGDRARIGLTDFNGKTIGAGLVLSTNKQMSIPWASTLRQFNRLAPNMLLYWNCLKFAADSGKTVFDFGRSTEGEGTFRFKKQWGAAAHPLPWYSSPSEIFQETKNKKYLRRETLEMLWRKLPKPIVNYIGPHIRKYINL